MAVGDRKQLFNTKPQEDGLCIFRVNLIMKKLLFCSLITVGLSSSAYATDLMDVYQQALANDPIFKNAYDTYMANAEAVPQARAALRPQLTLSGQGNRNYFEYNSPSFGATAQYYNSAVWQVTASQALFNYESWAKVRQAKAYVKAAQATFNDSAQDLILRTAKAYFDVLYAQDTLEFAEAKKEQTNANTSKHSNVFKLVWMQLPRFMKQKPPTINL